MSAVALAPGTELEGYRVERVLGQGGFGITYGVTDQKLGLRLALKEYFPRGVAERDATGQVVPSPGHEAEYRRGLERFLREARTLARLDHPGVVRVQRYFESLGTAYLAMDWLDGESLDRLLSRGGAFREEEIQVLLGPLLDALAYLHGAGVVHGDIKPSNIFLTREGRPVLIDFGAARLARDLADAPILGSEGYAAPEQDAGGDRSGAPAIGPWTDLYGLSATLYRLLSGETPVSARQRLRARSQGAPDPLPGLGPARPRGSNLAGAVEAGLRLAVEDRPSSVDEWRRLWGPTAPRAAAGAIGKSENVAVSTSWLPRLLLGTFVVVLVLMAAYLLLGERRDPGAGPAGTDRPATATRAPEADAWDQAVRSDNVAGYRAYLEAFPMGANADNAEDQLRVLDDEAWAKALSVDERQAFEDYLEQFPEGGHLVEARARIAGFLSQEEAQARAREQAQRVDEEAWRQALNRNTLASLDDYLQRFPDGLHRQEAIAAREALLRAAADDEAFTAAEGIGRAVAYRSYLEAFPDGRHVAEALAALEELVLRPGKVFRDCPDCPRMVVLPAGAFEQGAVEGDPLALSNEKPPRTVRLARPFAIGVHEVTFAEWDACVAAGGCRGTPSDNGWGRGQRPVIWVSWEDARSYAQWLSERTGERYQLPSESQWEYAARSGEAGPWLGGSPQGLCDFGNVAGVETPFDWRHAACSDPFSFGTATVGYFEPNGFGIHDMIGNVAEWTRDCMNISYLDAPKDGSAWERGLCASRVTRGGSWFSGSAQLRLSSRFNLQGGERNDFTGFRVVREIRD